MHKIITSSILFCTAILALPIALTKPIEPDVSSLTRTNHNNSTRALLECTARQQALFISYGFTAEEITTTDRRNWYISCSDIARQNDKEQVSSQRATAGKGLNSDLVEAIKENTKALEEIQAKDNNEDKLTDEELRELVEDYQAKIDEATINRDKYQSKLDKRLFISAQDSLRRFIPDHWLDWTIYLLASLFLLSLIIYFGRRWCCPSCCACIFGSKQTHIGGRAKDTRHRSA